MRKALYTLLGACLLCACQETMDQRCAREAEEFTRKSCPAMVNMNTRIDSLTFNPATRTIAYCYSLLREADRPDAVNPAEARRLLLQQVTNEPSMKPYRDAGYRIAYIYRSASQPSQVLYQTVFTEEDYKR